MKNDPLFYCRFAQNFVISFTKMHVLIYLPVLRNKRTTVAALLQGRALQSRSGDLSNNDRGVGACGAPPWSFYLKNVNKNRQIDCGAHNTVENRPMEWCAHSHLGFCQFLKTVRYIKPKTSISMNEITLGKSQILEDPR